MSCLRHPARAAHVASPAGCTLSIEDMASSYHIRSCCGPRQPQGAVPLGGHVRGRCSSPSRWRASCEAVGRGAWGRVLMMDSATPQAERASHDDGAALVAVCARLSPRRARGRGAVGGAVAAATAICAQDPQRAGVRDRQKSRRRGRGDRRALQDAAARADRRQRVARPRCPASTSAPSTTTPSTRTSPAPSAVPGPADPARRRARGNDAHQKGVQGPHAGAGPPWPSDLVVGGRGRAATPACCRSRRTASLTEAVLVRTCRGAPGRACRHERRTRRRPSSSSATSRRPSPSIACARSRASGTGCAAGRCAAWSSTTPRATARRRRGHRRATAGATGPRRWSRRAQRRLRVRQQRRVRRSLGGRAGPTSSTCSTPTPSC